MLVVVNENLSAEFGKHYGSREQLQIKFKEKRMRGVQFSSDFPRFTQHSTFFILVL